MSDTMKRVGIKEFCFLTILTLAYLFTVFLQMWFNRTPYMSFNGVLMAFGFLFCLLMIFVDYNSGILVAGLCMFFSIINVFFMIWKNTENRIAPLPGLVNTIIYMCTLLLLVSQFRRRDQESITDFLTGLRNRRGLYKVLRSKISANSPFTVVYLDLGNFKQINDNYGHTFGDTILKLTSQRITSIIGKNNIATRIAGDEFVLILNNNTDPYTVTQKIIDEIGQKKVINSSAEEKIEIFIKAYAGIARFPNDATTADNLVKYADIAMYEAAKSKMNSILYFDQKMAEKLTRQIEVEQHINEALENNLFYMVYQPQYELAQKKLRGFESLLRLKTADGEFISPAEFIPVAEKKDLILRIDDYVMRRVMNEFRDVVLNDTKNLVISINVSAKNIGNEKFIDKVTKCLEETGFPAKNLEIEITEYCLVQSVEVTIANIIALRNLGVQVALDDFGTGYTSLSYLAKMPINLLKVDKSLVDDIETNKKSQEFVNAVIAMGHLMGCEVISEGTENENQLTILKDQKCDFVQGYVWGKPMEYEDAKSLCTK